MVVLIVTGSFLEPRGVIEMGRWRMDAFSGIECRQITALGDS